MKTGAHSGRPLFDGAFKLHDTDGLPLGMVIDACRKHGIEVDLSAFLKDAIKAGWKVEKARAVISEALRDAVPAATWNNTMAVIDAWIKRYKASKVMP